MTTIYESAIETSTEFEGALNDVLREYGADLAELTRRLHVRQAAIAGEQDWKSFPDGSSEVRITDPDGTSLDYTAYIRKIKLVC
jgi:hypothetical protein